MNITDILEESPNGYQISSGVPVTKNSEEIIRYYLMMLERFPLEVYPVDFAVTNYSLARFLFGDRVNAQSPEDKAKRIENSLFYFHQAQIVFSSDDYPIMYSIICIYMGHLYRERSSLINTRSFLKERSTPAESLQYGLDQVLEAAPLLALSKVHIVEYAICNLELGYLSVLLSEIPEYWEDNMLREQAIGYLERVLTLSKEIPSVITYKSTGGKPYRWNVTDPHTFPLHIKHFLDEFNFPYIEGAALCLLGRAEEGCAFHGLNEITETEENYVGKHALEAFEYYTQAVKPKFLPNQCSLWADAHHRAGLLLVKFPHLLSIKDDDDGDDEDDENQGGFSSYNLQFDAAITHFHVGLRCKAITRTERMDLHFHAAQCLVAKLQRIIDRVPFGQSITKAIIANEGVDLMNQIEENLREALSRVTAANTQSSQDAYVYYYSSLKLAEYRMLQAACASKLSSEQREDHLKESIEYVIDACHARSLADNMDLHYVAATQMAQMLGAVKRSHAASKAYAKVLMITSVLINRSNFNPEFYEGKLNDDIHRHSTQAIAVTSKEISWVKLHIGPISLHERAAAGFAAWSFEDLPSRKRAALQAKVVAVEHNTVGKNELTGQSLVKPVKPSPPKSVPPLQLSALGANKKTKKVFVSGEDVPDDPKMIGGEDDDEDKFLPPAGPVPLEAMAGQKHAADALKLLEEQDESSTGFTATADGEEPRLPMSPYTGRLRSKVPPLSEMKEIDKRNRAAFGFPKGHAVYLIPSTSVLRKVHANRKKFNKFAKNNNAMNTVEAKETVSKGESRAANKLVHADENNSESDGLRDGDEIYNIYLNEEEEEDDTAENNAHLYNFDDDDQSEREALMRTNLPSSNDLKATQQSPSAPREEADNEDRGTRERSRKVRWAPSFSKSSAQKNSSDASASTAQSTQTQQKSRGLFGLLGRKKHQSISPENGAESEKPPKKSSVLSIFNPFRGKNNAKQASQRAKKKKKKKKNANTNKDKLNEVGFWASKQAFYIFMVLSRVSRLELSIRSKRLKLLDSERSCNVFYNTKSKYLAILYQIRAKLFKDCAKLILPPSALRDLTTLNPVQLNTLFRSHAKIAASLDELEIFLYQKMSKVDFFVSVIGANPCLTRDIGAFDESLLDAETLLQNISTERNLALKRDFDEATRLKSLAQATSTATSTPSKSKFDYDSVSSLANTSKGAHTVLSKTTSGNSAAGLHALTKEERRQRQEEIDEVRAGKMTYSLSQVLDGAGYFRFGQQGSKDMLMQCVAHDECLLVWHLPTSPAQKIIVVLVWRENSQSLHKHYSSQQSVDARFEGDEDDAVPPPDLPDHFQNHEISDDKYQRKTKKTPVKEEKKAAEAAKKSENNSSNKKSSNKNSKKSKLSMPKGIVMEVARLDLDASHLNQLLQRYFDAIHTKSAAQRATLANDALQSLSCALSVTELLLLIPASVKSLVFCGSPLLRMLPWHLLLFEDSFSSPGNGLTAAAERRTDGGVVVRHLLERYQVRWGPSLCLFELNCEAGRRLKQTVGLHRLCAVDGDDRQFVRQGPLDDINVARADIAGIRAADLEVSCVASTWSADPEDYRVISDEAAAKINLETGLFLDRNLMKYKKYKSQLGLLRGDEEEEERRKRMRMRKRRLREQNVAQQIKREQRRKQREKERAQRRLERELLKRENKFTEEDAINEMLEEDESEESEESDESDEMDDEELAFTNEHRENVYSLTMCRVLHLAANKVPLDGNVTSKLKKVEAAVYLPADPVREEENAVYEESAGAGDGEESEEELEEVQDYEILVHRQRTKKYRRRRYNRAMTAADLVKQLYIRNCALCVMSRFGLTDDVLRIDSNSIDSNWEFVEAAHFAGASTVLVPMFQNTGAGGGNALAALANVLFLVRFYSILPSKSRERLATVEACRRAQLWLRDVTANDAIAFIHKAPIPAPARREIIAEMESYVLASLSPEQQRRARERAEKKLVESQKSDGAGEDEDLDRAAKNREGGENKFFTHFLTWGSFIVSGAGGGVHHPELTEENELDDAADGNYGDGLLDDEELDNILFEAAILRMEGKILEAQQLERRIRQLRLNKVKSDFQKLRVAGYKAGRTVMDTLDYLDKTFLDQDSDEVSVSDDSADHEDADAQRRRETALSLLRESESQRRRSPGERGEAESDEEEDDSDDGRSKKARTPFRPLDLDTRNKDVEYEEWRTKINDLNMSVKQPTLPASKSGKLRRKPKIKQSGRPSPSKGDSFDYEMMQSMKMKKTWQEERDEREREHLEDKLRSSSEEEEGDFYDDDEDGILRKKKGRVIFNKGTLPDINVDQENQKPIRRHRKKDRRHKKKVKLWNEIFGGVRSYYDIALMLADRVQDQAEHAEQEVVKALKSQQEKLREKYFHHDQNKTGDNESENGSEDDEKGMEIPKREEAVGDGEDDKKHLSSDDESESKAKGHQKDNCIIM